jgi:hypothetical protein
VPFATFRFTPTSRRKADVVEPPVSANFGLMQRNKGRAQTITTYSTIRQRRAGAAGRAGRLPWRPSC